MQHTPGYGQWQHCGRIACKHVVSSPKAHCDAASKVHARSHRLTKAQGIWTGARSQPENDRLPSSGDHRFIMVVVVVLAHHRPHDDKSPPVQQFRQVTIKIFLLCRSSASKLLLWVLVALLAISALRLTLWRQGTTTTWSLLCSRNDTTHGKMPWDEYAPRPIPHIIHQSWKDGNVPDRFKQWQV